MHRLTMLWSLAIAGSLFAAPLTHAQTHADSSRAAMFDRLDRTSRMLISTVSCARRGAKARADGLFGPPDSLGRRGQCLRKDGRAFVVFFSPDSTFTKAARLRVADIENMTPYPGPVDTAAILAEARVAQEAVLKGFPSYQQANRQFAPFSMRLDGDSIEVWLVPVGLLVGRTPSAVGGERAFIYSPDGRTLAREIDAFDRHRALTVPDSGRVEILSREDDLPLVSELIAANLLHSQGREVQLVTNAYTSVLPKGAEVWIQLRKR